MNPNDLWAFLPFGYLTTVLIEAPILLLGLSSHHPRGRRLFAGLWLTACTYPIVVLVLPLALDSESNRGLYLWVAETFAPLAECLLFTAMVGWKEVRGRDWLAIVVANLASFGFGELLSTLQH